MISKKFTADEQLKSLIEELAVTRQRGLIFVYNDSTSAKDSLGDKVMVIHHLMAKKSPERPSVLWCHKKNSETPKVSRKELKALEKSLKAGECSLSPENAFSIFLLSTPVTFCSFDQTPTVLGKTFGMCVIQDFDGLTPNILCRVVETVQGGGVAVVILPKQTTHLRELFPLPMSIHSKLKTHSHPNIQPRFNERFVLSLGWCKTCLLLDSELKVRKELKFQKAFRGPAKKLESEAEDAQMEELLESLSDAEKPLPHLVKLCRTVDQAKALLKMVDVITDKGGRATVSLTAARGRGKSASLGLATASAIFFGLSNIYVSSPSPGNLSTFFEFLCRGLEALDYQEHQHFDLIQSTNPEFQKAIVRLNVFARHRQTVQYVSPEDSHKVNMAELVVIDEAAAIPLPRVKAMLGLHNVFMASTVNGYEGTGRSLSLKLLKELRRQTTPLGATAASSVNKEDVVLSNCRPLHEVAMETSIRYPPNDPVEKWLNRLLCLDATAFIPPITHCPHADACDLYGVNRDVLMSGHPETEGLLRQILSLLVSSHYRNSPDDLQILSDSPAHRLFVLLPPIDPKSTTGIPSIFAVIQVSFEGDIPTSVSDPILSRGEKPDGDLIPWTLGIQFLRPKFTKLKGLRVVRIATHTDYQSMGYGSRAMRLLKEFYEGKFIALDDEPKTKEGSERTSDLQETVDQDSLIGPRPVHEPLLRKLNEMEPEHLDYIGVSFGLTEPLLKFWKRLNFLPLYISQNFNKITGEHNCIMIHPMGEESFSISSSQRTSLPKWLRHLAENFFRRFLTLLGGVFKTLPHTLGLSIVSSFANILESQEFEWNMLEHFVSGPDMKRVESYSKNLCERHLVTDLLPTLANLFFSNHLPALHLSTTQATLLLGTGLQFTQLEEVGKTLDLAVPSTLGQFNRMMKRIFKVLSEIQEKNVVKRLPKEFTEETFNPVSITLEEDLEQAAEVFEKSMAPHPVFGDLDRFAIRGGDDLWNDALNELDQQGIVSIKSQKRPARMTEEELEKELTDPHKKHREGKRPSRRKFNKPR